jgi:hypothetical protein
MHKTNKVTLTLLAFMLLATFQLHAFVEIRVSVKIFVDYLNRGPYPAGWPNEEFNPYDTAEQVRNAFKFYNSEFDKAGWGIRLQLTDVTAITESDDSGNFHTLEARDEVNRNNLEVAAKLPGSTLHYRADAINVYINNTSSGISGGHLPLLGDVIFMGIGSVTNKSGYVVPDGSYDHLPKMSWVQTLLHETGHAMGLCHTHGCLVNGCGDPQFPNVDCHSPGDDGCGDTILDVSYWNPDQIAQANFGGLSYTNLNAGQARQVDMVYSNIMSYHKQEGYILTHEQWEKIVDTSTFNKANVMTGHTLFVDRNNNCLRPEDLASPFDDLASHTPGWSWGTRFGLGVTLDPMNPPSPLLPVACPPNVTCPLSICLGGPYKNVQAAVTGASPGDRLQIKSGNYGDTFTISKRLTLATDQGPVFIGRQ